MAFGDKCERCGKCCAAIPCGIGLALIGDKRPCRALERNEDGQYQCGLVVHASEYVDLGKNTDWKDKFLGEMFAHMLGIGMGCCSSLDVDLNHHIFLENHKNRKPNFHFD